MLLGRNLLDLHGVVHHVNEGDVQAFTAMTWLIFDEGKFLGSDLYVERVTEGCLSWHVHDDSPLLKELAAKDSEREGEDRGQDHLCPVLEAIAALRDEDMLPLEGSLAQHVNDALC